MSFTVESNEQGRLVIPAEVRAALHVKGKGHWQLDVQDGAIILKPAIVIPREDAWAYRPDHRERLDEALSQAQSDQIVDLSPEQLDRLMDQALE